MYLLKSFFYGTLLAIVFHSCNNPTQGVSYSNDSFSNLVEPLADSAYNNCMSGDSVTALEQTLRLLKLADHLEIGIAKADAYRTAGMVYNNWMDYENSFFFYRKSEQILNQLTTEDAKILRAKLWLNMSLLYLMGGEFQTAIDYALKGDSVFSKHNMVPYSINAYSKVCEIYERLQNNEKAIYYYQKLFLLLPKTADPFSKATCILAKGNLCIIEKDYKNALQWVDSAEQIADSEQILESKINCLLNKALILKFINPGDPKIIELLLASVPVIEAYDNPYQKADVFYRIANTYFQIGNAEQSFKYIQKAEQLADKFLFTNLKRQNKLLLSELYSLNKNYEKAYLELVELEPITQKYYSEQTTKDLLFANARYEAQTREVQIEKLETENKLKQAAIDNKNMLLIGGLAILVLVLLVAFLWIRYFKQKQLVIIQEKKIQAQRIMELEKEKEMIALQATMKGEEAERGRIAHDLHDGLGGLLSGVKLSIHHMKDQFIISSEMAQVFNQSLTLIDASVQELRRVAHHMMPEILIDAGINGALESYCYSMPDLGKTSLTFNSFGPSIRRETGFELAVYRIAQELINNAIKHAQAFNISVQLLQDEHRICLTVTDDGTGFKQDNNLNEGRGLQGIRSRVSSFNGRLDIQTGQGKGTEVLVEFANLT